MWQRYGRASRVGIAWDGGASEYAIWASDGAEQSISLPGVRTQHLRITLMAARNPDQARHSGFGISWIRIQELRRAYQ